MNGMDMLRVGIYRGDFSPVHNGHVASAKAFMEQMKLDYLFVVPCFMQKGDYSSDPIFRLKMCELAFADVDGVIISDTEIRRGAGASLYGTVKELTREGTRLFLLCGSDEALSFDKTERYEDILKMCYPNYVRRENDPLITAKIVAKLGEYYEKHGVMFRRIITDPIDISSKKIRRAISEGKSISGLVAPEVENFIKENRLYLD